MVSIKVGRGWRGLTGVDGAERWLTRVRWGSTLNSGGPSKVGGYRRGAREVAFLKVNARVTKPVRVA